MKYLSQIEIITKTDEELQMLRDLLFLPQKGRSWKNISSDDLKFI